MQGLGHGILMRPQLLGLVGSLLGQAVVRGHVLKCSTARLLASVCAVIPLSVELFHVHPNSLLGLEHRSNALAFFLVLYRSWQSWFWRLWKSLLLGGRGAFTVFLDVAWKVVWGGAAVWCGTVLQGSSVSACDSSLFHLAVSI